MKIQNTPEELEIKIKKAIIDVRDNEMTMKETGIVKLLHDLNELRENPASALGGQSSVPGPVDKLYLQLASEWKEVSKTYLSTKKGALELQLAEAKRASASRLIQDAAVKTGGGGGSQKSISDSELTSGPSTTKEGRVRSSSKSPSKKIPKQSREKGDRDRKTYKFMGAEYGKGKLVHAIIKHHVDSNPKITVQQLKLVFPDHLLKGYGLIRLLAEAQEISKQHKRFFLKEDYLIKCSGGTVAVCNQFSVDNIKPFFEHATKKLGYEIEGI